MEPSYIELLEENTRLQNEIDELKEYLNKDACFDLEKVHEMIKTEISEHIKKTLNFDLEKVNEIIRSEISKHITAQLANFSIEQNDTKNEMKDDIDQNISTYNVDKNMLFDIKFTNPGKIKKTGNNIKKKDAIVPICDLKLVNDIIKEENLDLCVVSHGGCCTNQLVDVLIENGYNIRTNIWENILCHCPEYIDIDVPIIYIYGNPMTSFLSVKKRGDGFWNSNQQKLSNNENTKLSDENLLKLMINQTNTWINIKKDNVLILKNSEIFEEPILDKLQTFLKKDLHSFPIEYKKPKTSLENLSKDELMLFQKYKNDINKIIKKYLYDL